MATKRMLVDATQPEETRIVVTNGNRLEEFDFESADHKQIKGNIYLAKVTRVEPSLQAAFVDFGGNRHGFLAFSEIHPDYYQIPTADRDALLAEEAEAAEEEERLRAEEEDEGIQHTSAPKRRRSIQRDQHYHNHEDDDTQHSDGEESLLKKPRRNPPSNNSNLTSQNHRESSPTVRDDREDLIATINQLKKKLKFYQN